MNTSFQRLHLAPTANTQMQLDEARVTLQSLEDECADLEQRIEAEGDASTRKLLREQLKQLEEKLDAQRRIYEDLEFKELEDQSRVEEEREHLFREVVTQQSDLIHKFKDKEAAMERLSAEGRKSAARVQTELDEMEAERACVQTGIRREKQRMRVADAKTRELQSRLPPPTQPHLQQQLSQHPNLRSFQQRQQQGQQGFMDTTGIMTSSGYASHRGMSGVPLWFGHAGTPSSPEEDGLGTTDASYQSSLMTASLHEDLHGRFNELAAAAPSVVGATESCGTYDNPTSLVNSYHAGVPSASNPLQNGNYEQEESDFASLTQLGFGRQGGQLQKTRDLEPKKQQKEKQPNSLEQHSLSKPQETQKHQKQHQMELQPPPVQQQVSQPDSASGASDVAKRYQRIGSDSSSGSTVPSLTAAENKDSKKNRPLTCYMPCSDPSFDLREHLLSQGHPLDVLQRQVEITQCSCRGYLTKQGGKFKSLKKRWFVLDRYRRTFSYFIDRSEAKIKGCVSFCDILDAYIDRAAAGKSSSGKRGAAAAFCVSTTERIYRCVAPSPEAMRVWIDSVFTAAEGYLLQTQ